MPEYTYRNATVEAYRFPSASLTEQEAYASFCGGRVRGTCLPPEDRIVQIDTPFGELEARVGDWIVRLSQDYYICVTDTMFHNLFAECDRVG